MTASARQDKPAAQARIHLRIKHPKLDPAEITRVLAMTPEHTLQAGRRVSSSGVESYWIAPLSFPNFDEPWLLPKNDLAENSLANTSALRMMGHEAVVGLALRQLQPHQEFFQQVHEAGGTATLLIDLDQPGSITIQPTLARKLADASLGLELDWSGDVE